MSTYLMHHGILGMKWGVRRFQNEDGTRTAEGKRREKLADIARRKYGEYKDRQKAFGQYRKEHPVKYTRDAIFFGRGGVKRLYKNIEVKGQSKTRAYAKEAARRVAKSALVSGISAAVSVEICHKLLGTPSIGDIVAKAISDTSLWKNWVARNSDQLKIPAKTINAVFAEYTIR